MRCWKRYSQLPKALQKLRLISVFNFVLALVKFGVVSWGGMKDASGTHLVE